MRVMIERNPKLRQFLDLTEEAIVANAHSCEGASHAATRIFTALRDRQGSKSDAPSESLPVCGALDVALRIAGRGPPPIPRLATALAELSPHLIWRRRKGAETESRAFYDGHANALVVGPEGIEQRNDAMIGISLMAPHVRYPDHRHPPEEVYVSLAGGAWWKEGKDWHQPRSGGLVYNEPNVLHAMATEEEPLLAIWCLKL
jgi:quercetin dioxygenase-like cupin family protein